jgi:hypothetical protein
MDGEEMVRLSGDPARANVSRALYSEPEKADKLKC